MKRYIQSVLRTLASIVFLYMMTSCDRDSIPTTTSWPFRTEGEIFSLPFCGKASIYFGACDGNFYCVDKKSAVLRWKRTGFHRIDSDPIIVDQKVYFAAIDNRVHALSTHDGSTVWETRIPGVGSSNPKLRENVLLISADNQLVELSLEKGNVLHRYRVKGEVDDFSWNSSGIAVVINRDISSNDYRGKGSVVFFKHGANFALWQTELGGSCLGRIICDEKSCYLGARDGVFYAIDASNGNVIWQVDCSKLFAKKSGVVWADDYVMSVEDKVVFTASHQNIGSPSVLVCAAKIDGRILWKVEHPTQICGSFEIVSDKIIAIAEDRKILSVDTDTGDFQALDLLPKKDRGEFVGIRRDGDYLFVVGADAHVWRLPLSNVMGKKTKD